MTSALWVKTFRLPSLKCQILLIKWQSVFNYRDLVKLCFFFFNSAKAVNAFTVMQLGVAVVFIHFRRSFLFAALQTFLCYISGCSQPQKMWLTIQYCHHNIRFYLKITVADEKVP